MIALLCSVSVCVVAATAAAGDAEIACREVRRFDAPEATQGVAVDDRHFYAIGNRVIAKYEKELGEGVARWTASDELPLAHLNAGIVRDGRLYCTGHDRGELYQLALPQAGSTLRLVATIAAFITGQAFAWDRNTPGILYGIDRPKRQVVVVQLTKTRIASPHLAPGESPGAK